MLRVSVRVDCLLFPVHTYLSHKVPVVHESNLVHVNAVMVGADLGGVPHPVLPLRRLVHPVLDPISPVGRLDHKRIGAFFY